MGWCMYFLYNKYNNKLLNKSEKHFIKNFRKGHFDIFQNGPFLEIV